MTWIRKYQQKKLISKISVDSIFMFSSYAGLCVFHCSHRLLRWITSCTRDFLWKVALISYRNNFSLIHLEKCASLRGATKLWKRKKIKFWQFWERPLFNIREYAFNKMRGFSNDSITWFEEIWVCRKWHLESDQNTYQKLYW